ncbi:MAG: MFS transporter [Actinomycetales bacterium]|nr:MFS transporter [Actinomycetales bacterium]
MTRRLPRPLRPFATSRYRLLASALSISLFGTGVWTVALVFQVKALGGGPTDLSAIAAVNAAALLAAVLFGGVAADRIPQKRILVAVEIVKTLAVAGAAALGLSGALELWHLAIVAALLGLADGFFYPAYSAVLPAILPEDDLLAANGVEGVLRPAFLQAAGPAAASAAIAAFAPPAAFLGICVTQLAAIALLLAMPAVALARDATAPADRDGDGVVDAPPRHPIAVLFLDLWGGVRFMVRTPWLFATLLFATVLVLLIMGPLEVLLPFAVTRQTGGGPESFAAVLTAFGLGGALASILVSVRPLPRRYLTLMVLAWGVGAIPFALIGVTDQLWVMVIAAFVVGVTFDGAQVIWGTLLQRRVPPTMLGRVSSLDFFVSLALMPISMALAGPVGETIGFPLTFALAGLIPPVLAVVTIVVARMPADEIAHPLDRRPPATAPIDLPDSGSGGPSGSLES